MGFEREKTPSLLPPTASLIGKVAVEGVFFSFYAENSSVTQRLFRGGERKSALLIGKVASEGVFFSFYAENSSVTQRLFRRGGKKAASLRGKVAAEDVFFFLFRAVLGVYSEVIFYNIYNKNHEGKD